MVLAPVAGLALGASNSAKCASNARVRGLLHAVYEPRTGRRYGKRIREAVTNSFWLKNAGLRLNFLSLAQNLSLEIPSLAREKQAQKFEPGIPGSKIEPGMQPFGQAQNLS